jgi:hypothetical protein
VLDADEEEFQVIGHMRWADRGNHTFGTSSSIGWIAGASTTFADDGATDPTLRVGVKKASSIDLTTGQPARATIGGAAFDVYDDLIGGTDTITSAAWRTDTMSAGTPFTLNNGDQVAVCLWLDKPGAGSQSVKVRVGSASQQSYPCITLVTSGPTYTAQTHVPIFVLTADDGTIGWIAGSTVVSATTASETIGDTNLYGNIWTPIFNCTVDALQLTGNLGASITNPDFGIWSDPLGTPTPMSNGTVSLDLQTINTLRNAFIQLPSEVPLSQGVPYAMAVKQNSSTAVATAYYDVNATAHFQINGLDENYYAAKSTAGGAFAAANSGKRRANILFRVSQIDFPHRIIGG